MTVGWLLAERESAQLAEQPRTGTTSDAPEPGATPAAATRPQPLTSQSRSAPLCAIHS
ncbi:hypothetical protein WMF45_01245 [Sorangium sp. So ce448]|uniref:hypothetical protein n=1 Tax=Sorangium sp. So ce448 TaxID=3133314 RepID=UPI003F627F3F